MKFHHFVCAALLAACNTAPQPIDVVVAEDAAVAQVDVANDLAAYLSRIQRGPVRVVQTTPGKCQHGRITIWVQGPGTGQPLGFGAYEWTRDNCRDGVLVQTRGVDLLASQHAVYGLLERFDVRFYHPEQEWLPTKQNRLDWALVRNVETFTPDFRERSSGAHLSHPVELYTALTSPTPETEPYVKRWVDWSTKNRMTSGQWSRLSQEYGLQRGYTYGGGLNLFESQQGSVPLILITDTREHNEARIVEAIDAQFAAIPNLDSFGLLFNASEFPDSTPIDDREVVHYLTFIADYMALHHPSVPLFAMNHGTYTKPTEHYGVRYFDLMLFAPLNMGIKLHSLMFYDLFRPAPMYGNKDFTFMHDIIRDNAASRRIYYFPEHAWWLTFDLPVPLYFPITMETRSYDIQRLRPYALSATAEHGLLSHQAFSTGQEWGYWQQDWCSARMAFDTRLTNQDCFADFAKHSSAPNEVLQALNEVTAVQVELLLDNDPQFIRYLVGSDDQTEAGEAAGILFHPLPPTPQQIQLWPDTEVGYWTLISKPKLERWISVFNKHADALSIALGANDWLGQEIRDGITINGLRAEHSLHMVEASLALRQARQEKNAELVATARHELEAAQALTAGARVVVERRESQFRYPLAWSIAGDEPGTPGALPNGTQYTYRYLSRAHRLYYWTRPETLLAGLLDDSSVVRVDPRISLNNEPTTVALANFGEGTVSIEWGDGTSSATLEPHTYAQGVHSLSIAAVGDVTVAYSENVATVSERRVTRPQNFDVEEPVAAAVLTSLFPGLVVGQSDADGGFIAFGPDTDGDGNIDPKSLQTSERVGSHSQPLDVEWPLVNSSTGQKLASITLHQLVIDVSEAKDVKMNATLETADIVRLLIDLAAFDEQGARKTIASALGYTEANLPDSLAIKVRAEVL